MSSSAFTLINNTLTFSFAQISHHFRNLFRFFALQARSPFWLHLSYFIFLWLLGSLLMVTLKPSNPSFNPRYIDMLYMSASAVTVSGLNSVEMENFSSSQIMVLTLLMLFGGEVSTSLLALLLRRVVKCGDCTTTAKQAVVISGSSSIDQNHHHQSNNINARVDPICIELDDHSCDRQSSSQLQAVEFGGVVNITTPSLMSSSSADDSQHKSVTVLGLLLLGYHFVFHLFGTIFVLVYVSIFSSAKNVLKGKGINRLLFAFSVTVSSFANGGLIPTNENMMIFKTNTGLLLCIVILVLAGNTMLPPLLRVVAHAYNNITRRKTLEHIIKHPTIAGCYSFPLIMSKRRSSFLAATVVGLIAVQITLYCVMDWQGKAFGGLSTYQKLVSALFMAANARHAGENSLDLSVTSPAVLVLFIIMMYLPGSATFLPAGEADEREQESDKSSRSDEEKHCRKINCKKRKFVETYVVSQLSCIAICLIVVCITERKKISTDPLNFSVLNIAFETMSAYGNVGFSTGYSCSRQMIREDGGSTTCKDLMVSLSGKWSDEGKLVLIFILLFGRMKSFTMAAGRAWKLS